VGVFVALFAACSGEENTVDGDNVVDGDLTVDGDATGDYPDGPYGYSQGDVMADFALKDSDGNTVRLSDYYGVATAIFINHSAGWCTVCREETPTLLEWYSELKDKGVVFLQAVFEKNNATPADQAFAAGWKDQYELTFPVLVDNQNLLLDYHPTIQQGGATYGTPLNIILDADMTIQVLIEGDVPHALYDRLVEIAGE
jgi:peroxiredoxin